MRGNILWARAGYDIYVANDSQAGFFSDYNNLYADQGGRIGYWTRDFTDVLDWQADIARFDLHSIGATVVNPVWAKPQFQDTDRNDFRLFAATGRPALHQPGHRRRRCAPGPGPAAGLPANLLANAGFEAGLSGWSANAGAGVKTGSPTAYEGSAVFQRRQRGRGPGRSRPWTCWRPASRWPSSMPAIWTWCSAAALRSLAESPSTAVWSPCSSSMPQQPDHPGQRHLCHCAALNASDRWELVGGRALIPTGARFAVLRFTADRDSGSSNDAWFDQAFLYAVSEAYVARSGRLRPRHP